MNRRSFFKFLPAMPVAAVAAAKVMAEEPKPELVGLGEYVRRDWKCENWLVNSDAPLVGTLSFWPKREHLY